MLSNYSSQGFHNILPVTIDTAITASVAIDKLVRNIGNEDALAIIPINREKIMYTNGEKEVSP